MKGPLDKDFRGIPKGTRFTPPKRASRDNNTYGRTRSGAKNQ